MVVLIKRSIVKENGGDPLELKKKEGKRIQNPCA